MEKEGLEIVSSGIPEFLGKNRDIIVGNRTYLTKNEEYVYFITVKTPNQKLEIKVLETGEISIGEIEKTDKENQHL